MIHGEIATKSKTVLVLCEDLYDELELWYPAIRMREEGHTVLFVGSGAKPVFTGKHGIPITADLGADGVEEPFHALIIPGGYAPDKLRRYPAVLELVRRAVDSGAVVATICHGPWVLISAGVVRGRSMTCVSAIRDDLINAGAAYLDREVVTDGNIITSRTPDDLPAFAATLVRALRR